MNKLVNAAALLLAGSRIATADVAPGFPLSGGASNLTVVYNGNDTVSPPGELLPRPVTAQRPSIAYTPQSTTSTDNTTQFILFMIDIDVPRNNTRVPLLHWLAPNTTFSASSSILSIPTSNPAPYLQPSPPVGDIPHAYTFLLLPQPPNFSIPAQYSALASNRVGFDVRRFLADTGVDATAVLASNWITVQNTTGTPTATFPPPRPPVQTNASGNGSAGYTGPESNGGSEGVVGSRGWMGLGTVVLVGIGAVIL